jgi:hypothetical protein
MGASGTRGAGHSIAGGPAPQSPLLEWVVSVQLALARARTHARARAHTRTHTHTLSLSHTHTLTDTRTPTHTHAHTHARTRTHSQHSHAPHAARHRQGMYLLLVTNRGSNILEDLDTLRLLSKLIPEYAGPEVDEEAVAAAAFDLVFAFDEAISLGHKENVTVQQARGGGRGQGRARFV